MTVLYYKRLCPFCDEDKIFSKPYNLRRHIADRHLYLLPGKAARESDNPKKEITDHNKHLFADVSFSIPCPSCTHYADSKELLRQHLLDIHSEFIVTQAETVASKEDWIVDKVNVTSKFHAFKGHCMEHNTIYRDVDKHFNQILSMSSIMVIQRRHKYEDIPQQFFGTQTLKAIYQNLENDFSFRQSFNSKRAKSVKNILKAYRDDQAGILDTQIKLLSLAQNTVPVVRNVILAINALLPAIYDLEVDRLNESELACSYVHPFIQGLFALTHDNRVARCANVIVTESDELQRPDYIVDIYRSYAHQYSSCVGEIKSNQATKTSMVMDFYRLALFSSNLINSGLDSALCFQAIGPSITFYYMLPKSDFHVLIELATIQLPTRKSDLLCIIGSLDDLYAIAYLHNKIALDGNPTVCPILPLDFVQGKKKSLPLKRKPSLGSIH